MEAEESSSSVTTWIELVWCTCMYVWVYLCMCMLACMHECVCEGETEMFSKERIKKMPNPWGENRFGTFKTRVWPQPQTEEPMVWVQITCEALKAFWTQASEVYLNGVRWSGIVKCWINGGDNCSSENEHWGASAALHESHRPAVSNTQSRTQNTNKTQTADIIESTWPTIFSALWLTGLFVCPQVTAHSHRRQSLLKQSTFSPEK